MTSDIRTCNSQNSTCALIALLAETVHHLSTDVKLTARVQIRFGLNFCWFVLLSLFMQALAEMVACFQALYEYCNVGWIGMDECYVTSQARLG